MARAKTGDTVKVRYTGISPNGARFDSTEVDKPLEFTIGKGIMIPGFEQAVIGMSVGDKKKVTIPPSLAYGERNESMTLDLPRLDIPNDIALELGMTLQASGPQGESLLLTVRGLTEETVTLDGNHPLAGRDLNYTIELIEISCSSLPV